MTRRWSRRSRGAADLPDLGHPGRSDDGDGTAYPLTTVVYAIINLTASKTDSLGRIADFVRFVVGDGQKPGVQVGELPPGYVPLSAALVTQANAAATAIDAYALYTPSPAPSQPTTSNPAPRVTTVRFRKRRSSRAEHGPEIIEGEPMTLARTPAASTVASPALAVSLAVGLSGALFAPWLFRGAEARVTPSRTSAPTTLPRSGKPPHLLETSREGGVRQDGFARAG